MWSTPPRKNLEDRVLGNGLLMFMFTSAVALKVKERRQPSGLWPGSSHAGCHLGELVRAGGLHKAIMICITQQANV